MPMITFGPGRHPVLQNDLNIAQVHGVIEHGHPDPKYQADQEKPAGKIPDPSSEILQGNPFLPPDFTAA